MLVVTKSELWESWQGDHLPQCPQVTREEIKGEIIQKYVRLYLRSFVLKGKEGCKYMSGRFLLNTVLP